MQAFFTSLPGFGAGSSNLGQPLLLLSAVGAVVALALSILWGWAGLGAAAAAFIAMLALAPRVPPETLMRLYRATRLPRDDSQLSSLVDVLTFRAGLPRRPDLYVIPSLTMNAFAAGSREHAAIAVTEGLLRRLSLAETAGVLAHEISHIKADDLRAMGVADFVTKFLQILAYLALGLALFNVAALVTHDQTMPWTAIALMYVAPALSSLIQLSMSRSREFEADAAAARLTGDPAGLASALRHLETSTGHLIEDLMFPGSGRRVPLPSLLRSHPETDERVRRLMTSPGVSEAPQHEALVIVEQPMISLVGYGPGDMRPRYRWPGLWF